MTRPLLIEAVYALVVGSLLLLLAVLQIVSEYVAKQDHSRFVQHVSRLRHFSKVSEKPALTRRDLPFYLRRLNVVTSIIYLIRFVRLFGHQGAFNFIWNFATDYTTVCLLCTLFAILFRLLRVVHKSIAAEVPRWARYILTFTAGFTVVFAGVMLIVKAATDRAWWDGLGLLWITVLMISWGAILWYLTWNLEKALKRFRDPEQEAPLARFRRYLNVSSVVVIVLIPLQLWQAARHFQDTSAPFDPDDEDDDGSVFNLAFGIAQSIFLLLAISYVWVPLQFRLKELPDEAELGGPSKTSTFTSASSKSQRSQARQVRRQQQRPRPPSEPHPEDSAVVTHPQLSLPRSDAIKIEDDQVIEMDNVEVGVDASSSQPALNGTDED